MSKLIESANNEHSNSIMSMLTIMVVASYTNDGKPRLQTRRNDG